MIQAATRSLAEIDVYDPEIYVTGVPHDAFRLLRREAPVFRHNEPGGPGYWALTAYRDVVTVSMDPVTFSSARQGVIVRDANAQYLAQAQGMLLFQDPPQHTQYRRLVSKGFTPRISQALEPRTRQMANSIIDNVIERGECDFVQDLAAARCGNAAPASAR